MKTSSFGGFIDGYKSSNIASIEGILLNKIGELVELLESAKELNNNGEEELTYFINKSLIVLKNKNKSDVIDLLITFGESLKLNISILSRSTGQVKEKVRKIIYNFVDAAKMSEDSTLINLAITIGSNY